MICPAGHPSDEDDYCSVCGAAMAAAPPASKAASIASPARPSSSPSGGHPKGSALTVCPSCGEPREDPDGRFCEVCRFDFTSHKQGPPPARVAAPSAPAAPPAPKPAPAPAPAPAIALAASPTAWEIVVHVDPALDTEPDPASPCPAGVPPRAIRVDHDLLVGRHDAQRDIHPEIPLHDPGSSRRHAKIVREPDGTVALQDLASTNGTSVNGKAVTPGARLRLAEGDEVTLGRWTRLVVRGAT